MTLVESFHESASKSSVLLAQSFLGSRRCSMMVHASDVIIVMLLTEALQIALANTIIVLEFCGPVPQCLNQVERDNNVAQVRRKVVQLGWPEDIAQLL